MLNYLNNLSRYTSQSYTLLKVVSGLMFSFHGTQKIFGILSNYTPAVGSQLWIGGIIEIITGVCIAFSIQTRLAAFLASGTMAVAYIQFHWKFQFGSQLIPIINKGELALLYSVLFLFLACINDQIEKKSD